MIFNPGDLVVMTTVGKSNFNIDHGIGVIVEIDSERIGPEEFDPAFKVLFGDGYQYVYGDEIKKLIP